MADSVALTPEEQRQFHPLFAQYDTDDTNIVLGERVRPLLERSGLPPVVLSQIWQTVDTENRGFLDYTDFSRCMRLLYHVQHGQQLSPRLANIPSGLPDLNRTPGASGPPQIPSPRVSSPRLQSPSLPTPTGPIAALNTGGSTFSANGETRIPALTTQDKKRFGALFDKFATSPDGLIEGAAAKEIFLKARMSPETLGKVWALVDVDGRGRLTKNEFVVAMHLIQSLIAKTMASLPSALPASWAPWLGQHQTSTASPASTTLAKPGHTGPPPQVLSEQRSPPPPPPSVPTTAPSAKTASLSIAPLERSQYDSIFDSLDRSKTGILGPNEAVPVLTKSGLSDEILARVWDLADRQKRGKLDKSDFALAMHLLKAKMNGQELPTSVPPDSQTTNAISPSGTGTRRTSENHTQVPPRRSMTSPLAQQSSGSFTPSQPQRTLTQQSTSSSLDDLVSLDSAVFRPLEPAKPPTRANTIPEEMNETSKETKFVPTTTFGQQLLQSRNRTGSVQAASTANSDSQAGTASDVSAKEAAARAFASPQPAVQAPAGGPAAAAAPAPDLQQQARELHDLESQVAAQQRERTSAHEELAAVLKEKADLESKVQELRVTYDNGVKEVHNTQKATTEAREAIKQLEKDIALRTGGLEAIRSQQSEQETARSAAEARRAELQEQLTQIQAQIDGHNTESQRFTEEQAQHKALIDDHETKLQQLKSEADRSAWRRRELEAESLRHRERVAQAQAAVQAQAQRAAAEAAAASEAEARAKAEHAAADAQPGASATASRAVPPSLAGSGNAGPPSVPALPIGSAIGAPHHRTNSLHSASESVPESAETPRTSPPSSEANYPAMDPVATPHFTLPMQQPHSATSSVVNNPPQSVRGDFGSEPSEPQSPDLSTPVSGINPPESMELRRNRGEDNDSFEFVDAREGQPGVENAEDESSGDDTGPADAIPQRYGEASPRQFHSELQAPSVHADTDSSSTTRTAATEPALASSSHATANPIRQPVESYAAVTQNQPTIPVSGVDQVGQQTAAVLSQPAAAAPMDEFDGFDDLEEAQDDDADDFGATFSSSQNNSSTAGPDEWQQLFASTGSQQPQHIARQQPSGSTAQQSPASMLNGPAAAHEPSSHGLSGAIAELTSMGFTENEARGALELNGNNLSEATNYLLDRM